MATELEHLKSEICSLLCETVKLYEKGSDLILVDLPFYFSDGDPYQIYFRKVQSNRFRITDMGHTLMHLSYENDISKFRDGTRNSLLEKIMAETNLKEENGAFYLESSRNNIAFNLLRFTQGITRINDLTFLNRSRAEATFYDDLNDRLLSFLDEEIIVKDYYTSIPNAKDYPIDYMIEGKVSPLFLFGIPNKDKALLTTIIIEHLLRSEVNFESLLVFADQSNIPKSDLARLSNAGGEMVASLDAEEALRRKIIRRVN